MRANKSLDASGGSVFLNLRGPAKGALIRAAASTQPFGAFFTEMKIREPNKMITLFFAAFIRPVFLATVCLSFFLQSNCNPVNTQNGVNAVSNNNSNVPNAKDGVYVPVVPKGNGAFALCYGESLSKFEQIRKADPNFAIVGHFDVGTGGPLDSKKAAQVRCVLNGQDPAECEKETGQTINNTKIKTLYYVSNTCGKDTLACSKEDRKKRAKAPLEYIKQQINGVMELGYDGIFFDVTDKPEEDFKRYKDMTDYAHSFKDKLVIVNPGISEETVCSMFNYADIVSVENRWNKKVPSCAGMNIASWRWLSVQGDAGGELNNPDSITPSDFSTAKHRLQQFRTFGGFWYYTPAKGNTDCDHCTIPDFLKALLDEARTPPVN
jgi:hypothetical protein